ncbi:peptidoglycan editing factor PgeF [Hahella aquimaris]|uniref:peptidoglycan editing factor PgeF n=1 Tax=Hahella sp. HNIBRBA332 TaxID=3015983 RepID=UPI00273B608A|nr:peptidoglycan editing factor PgeF [Hahella sp. HNIBRBA332]WLQ14067.1 peptidoglycan editing factor PgeF [Hahella sp. HNIBRBA332]
MGAGRLQLIQPDWPVPTNIRALVTTRAGGVSQREFASMNLGGHVGDDAVAVETNRRFLAQEVGLPVDRFHWLEQVHGVDVVVLKGVRPVQSHTGDAAFTTQLQQACCILTADCLPVLFAAADGSAVAAAHAGWRGLAAGVLENTAKYFSEQTELLVWLGPAISQTAFEVGQDVMDAFVAQEPESATCFIPSSSNAGKWCADLYALARLRLHRLGVTRIFGGDYCTYTDSGRFFSYRRDGVTGRMASVIWLASSP